MKKVLIDENGLPTMDLFCRNNDLSRIVRLKFVIKNKIETSFILRRSVVISICHSMSNMCESKSTSTYRITITKEKNHRQELIHTTGYPKSH